MHECLPRRRCKSSGPGTPAVIGGGVRPSSGAEGFACVAQPVFTGARNLSQIAAPEDGRTPALLNWGITKSDEKILRSGRISAIRNLPSQQGIHSLSNQRTFVFAIMWTE